MIVKVIRRKNTEVLNIRGEKVHHDMEVVQTQEIPQADRRLGCADLK